MSAASPEIDVEQLMTRIREEVARRKRQLGNPTVSAPPPANEPPAPLSPGLGELLRHEGDEVFVTRVYRTLLRREPEPGAIAGRLPILEEGGIAAKLDMLREICASEEGRNTGAEVRGLTTPYSLGELLGGADEKFIAHAYQILLGRKPDEDGLQTYLTYLREHSLSRIDVLRAVRFSEEGRMFSVEVAGLLPLVAGAFPAIAIKPDYTLGELLDDPDEAFIHNAYWAVLRREPDPEGLRIYLGRLRQGSLSKLDILGGLRYSSEGRKVGVAVHGLLMPWLLHVAYRIPLLGSLMALASVLLRPGKIIERLRSLEARLEHEGWQHRGSKHFDLELNQLKWLVDAKANQVELASLQDKAKYLQQGKADQSLLETFRVNWQNILESKADAGEISTLQLRLKQAVERLDSRADQQAVAELQNQLTETRALIDSRVDQQTVVELQDQLTETRTLIDSRADQQTVVELQNQLTETRVLIDSRADQQVIAELQGQLRVMAESKAEKSDLTGLTNHLAGLMQIKANADEVAAVREQVEVLASAKASNDALAEVRQTLEAKSGAEQLGQELAEIRRQILDHKRSIVDQQRRLALLLEEARKRLPDPLDTEQLAAFSGEADHVLDAMYVSFEDGFRGTRADIKQRLSAYLPSLPPGIGSSFAPAIDLGCGRGEWLELLKEHDLTVTGIDLNRMMAECCREQGLTVVEVEALAYLREQPDNSLGLITGFHIIEHLPLRTLIALFDEALRVLKPGGMVIFETPNPENLIVGACDFYMDPTHRNPMPPMMTQFLVEARGFVRVEIRRMNQQVLNDPLRLLESGTPGAAELNPLIQMAKEHYFAAPDYAVVAYKA